MYGYNELSYILREQGVPCKPKEQHLNSEAQGNLASGITKVKIWLQIGLEN